MSFMVLASLTFRSKPSPQLASIIEPKASCSSSAKVWAVNCAEHRHGGRSGEARELWPRVRSVRPRWEVVRMPAYRAPEDGCSTLAT